MAYNKIFGKISTFMTKPRKVGSEWVKFWKGISQPGTLAPGMATLALMVMALFADRVIVGEWASYATHVSFVLAALTIQTATWAAKQYVKYSEESTSPLAIKAAYSNQVLDIVSDAMALKSEEGNMLGQKMLRLSQHKLREDSGVQEELNLASMAQSKEVEEAKIKLEKIKSFHDLG